MNVIEEVQFVAGARTLFVDEMSSDAFRTGKVRHAHKVSQMIPIYPRDKSKNNVGHSDRYSFSPTNSPRIGQLPGSSTHRRLCMMLTRNVLKFSMRIRKGEERSE
jgi:hypothetical protein